MNTNRHIVVASMILMFLLGLVFIQESFAFPNEPTGYNGNKWGTSIGEINCELKLVSSIDKIKFEIYEPGIKSEALDSSLMFLDGKLAGHSIRFKDPRIANVVLMVYSKLYGKPASVSDEFVIWASKNTVIELDLAYGIIIIGSMSGIRSIEALLEWYESQGGKIIPERKQDI